jgi:hypothetical protein
MKRLLAVLTLITACVLIPASPAAAVGSPCLVPGPGWACNGEVIFDYYAISPPFRPFQAIAGTSSQPDITITFSSPYVTALRVWANDPDFANNKAWVNQSGVGWVQAAVLAGDGTPGVFSVSEADVSGHTYTAVRLESDDSDYVNWRLEYQRQPHAGGWCVVKQQSSNCDGVTATVSPFYQGSGFDPFQHTAGTGHQDPILIVFENSVYAVSVTAVDPDYSGTMLQAYSTKDFVVGSATFDADNTPNVVSVSTKSVVGTYPIKYIVLTSAANDYVTFQGLTITPL